MSESIGQDAVIEMFGSVSRWLRGVENAVNVVSDTSTARHLAITSCYRSAIYTLKMGNGIEMTD